MPHGCVTPILNSLHPQIPNAETKEKSFKEKNLAWETGRIRECYLIVLLDRLIGVRGQGEKISLEMGFEDSQEVTEANSRVSVTEAEIHGRRTRSKKGQN